MSASVIQVVRRGDFLLYRSGTTYTIRNDRTGQTFSDLEFSDLENLISLGHAGTRDVVEHHENQRRFINRHRVGL